MDAVTNLMPPTKDINSLKGDIMSLMQTSGDTLVCNIKDVLAKYGLILKTANGKYMRKGKGVGPVSHVLNKKDCRSVVRLKLKNLNNEDISYFIAWDGNILYDNPNNNIINRDKDLGSNHAYKMAFGMQITTVFELLEAK